MTTTQAIKYLESMPEDEFQAFFKSLPTRTQMLVKGGMVNWKACLADWYIKRHKEQ